MRTFHYEVIAGVKPKKDGTITNATCVIIHQASSEQDALDQAKEKITRPFYHIKTIYECHDCAKRELEMDLQSLHLKVLEKIARG